jgi:hypothetical protein
MCSYSVTVFACGHIADSIFLDKTCQHAPSDEYCAVFKWEEVTLKHWVCGGCGGSGRALEFSFLKTE